MERSAYDVACLAKPILLRHFSKDSCINTTRVLLEVFRALGIPAEACSVRVQLYTAGYIAMAEAKGRMPRTREEMMEWTDHPDVYSLGIGYGGIDVDPKAWCGHLAIRIGDGLLDATLDQADRPERGLILPSVLQLEEMPPEFWMGDTPVANKMSNGCVVRYEHVPRSNGYLASPAWAFRRNVEGRVYDEILARMKQ